MVRVALGAGRWGLRWEEQKMHNKAAGRTSLWTLKTPAQPVLGLPHPGLQAPG